VVAHKHLPIWRDAQRLTEHLHASTTKAPREMRYTLVQRLLSESVEVSVTIANANRASRKDRVVHIRTLHEHLTRVDVLLQVSLQQKCLSRKSAAHAIELLDNVARQRWAQRITEPLYGPSKNYSKVVQYKIRDKK
jgi:hypothetical protein